MGRLRLKMYRDTGFTPVEEDGVYTKVLVRKSCASTTPLLSRPSPRTPPLAIES